MRKFILKSISFGGLLLAFLFLVSIWPKKGNTYIEGILQKHERLEALPSPKIIFAGGSNLAFGINSAQIEQEFSLPVVNLSLHAGLGTSFILEELKQSIQPNDLVFLSLEYFLDSRDERLLRSVAKVFPPSANYFSIKEESSFRLFLREAKLNLKSDMERIFDPKPAFTDRVYHKNAFNEYGDVVAHLDETCEATLTGKTKIEYRYWHKIKELNALYDFANRKEVKVFFVFPAYAKSAFQTNEKTIALLENDLEKDLKMEVIGTASSFVYEDDLFFDTVYHLHKTGRERRTQELIELIKNNRTALERIYSTRREQ